MLKRDGYRVCVFDVRSRGAGRGLRAGRGRAARPLRRRRGGRARRPFRARARRAPARRGGHAPRRPRRAARGAASARHGRAGRSSTRATRAPAEAVAVLFPGRRPADPRGHLRRGRARAGARDRALDRAARRPRSRATPACRCSRSLMSPRATWRRICVGEAQEVFPGTILPRDFDVVELPFRERGEPTLVKGGARPQRTREETSAT